MRRRRIELDSFTPGGPLSEVVENEKGGLTIVIGPPRFLRARKLLKDGDPPAAVLAAQATSEAHVKRLLQDLMELAGLTEITLKRSRSLAFHRKTRSCSPGTSGSPGIAATEASGSGGADDSPNTSSAVIGSFTKGTSAAGWTRNSPSMFFKSCRITSKV
jgi:hypothetical protein